MPTVLKSGILNLLEPLGPVRALNGIALHLPLPLLSKDQRLLYGLLCLSLLYGLLCLSLLYGLLCLSLNIYRFSMKSITFRDYFPILPSLIGFYNVEVFCVLRGTK